MTNPKNTSSDLVERLREDGYNGHNPLCLEAADRIEALEARVAELEDVAGDLLTRFEPWSPHDHDADKRARAALDARHD